MLLVKDLGQLSCGLQFEFFVGSVSALKAPILDSGHWGTSCLI